MANTGYFYIFFLWMRIWCTCHQGSYFVIFWATYATHTGLKKQPFKVYMNSSYRDFFFIILEVSSSNLWCDFYVPFFISSFLSLLYANLCFLISPHSSVFFSVHLDYVKHIFIIIIIMSTINFNYLFSCYHLRSNGVEFIPWGDRACLCGDNEDNGT